MSEPSPQPVYVAQALLENAGRDLKYLILPAHHPELNSIELQWGRIKTYVERNNTTCNINDVEKLVRDEFGRITPDHWAGCERKAMKWEKARWDQDQGTDIEE
jgi:transposase